MRNLNGRLVVILALICFCLLACQTGKIENPNENGSSFTMALLADPHINGEPEHRSRLEAVITWINHHADERDIQLAVVLGDIGWNAQMSNAKEILDELVVPYVPLIGDNEKNDGDDVFDSTFRPQYDLLSTVLSNWKKAANPVWDPELSDNVWLQNFSFDFQGVHFIGLDWNVRGAKDGTYANEKGYLHDFAGGTLSWLEDELESITASAHENIVLLSHIPMYYGLFDSQELNVLETLITAGSDLVYANYAGHLHFPISDTMFSNAMHLYAIDATWEDENTLWLVTVTRDKNRFEYNSEEFDIPWQ